MAELWQETVNLSVLVTRAAQESFITLRELVEKSNSTEISDADKKVSLLSYVFKTQQRMLRLFALSKWCKQVPLINYLQEAADTLFYMHEGLLKAPAPVYDIPSSIEVLLTGSYRRLTTCLDDVGKHFPLDEDQQKQALRKLDVLVRSKLLETTLPKEITEVKVSKGVVTLSVDGEFKVLATLGYRGHISMWRILSLDLLVGQRSGPIKFDVTRRNIIGDDLERRMSVADNPFKILYSVLHEICLATFMGTVVNQLGVLYQGRWKGAIFFRSTKENQQGEGDYVSLPLRGLNLVYWLSDFDKKSGPFIEIEIGSDRQIKCSHSTSVIDPLTGKEAEFTLNKSCIDVESLLLKAIFCNIYTRLLIIQKELSRNARVCRASSDVILQSLQDKPGVEGGNIVDSEEQVEPEVLLVRAYGSSFFSLGINIRTGKFLLQSSKSTLTLSVLKEYEDALNQGKVSVADAFIDLRSKSILHVLAAISRFLGLEVYEHGIGSTHELMVLTLGLPVCESSHFLIVMLEKDFTPSFKLVEIQVDGSGKPQSLQVQSNVLGARNIDIGKIRILEDGLNLITSDAEGLNQASGHQHSGLIDEASAERSFSRIVDEVFGSDGHDSVPKNLHADSLHNLQGPLQSSSSSLFAISSDGLLLREDHKSLKHSASDLLRLIPSLRGVESTTVETSTKPIECSCANLITEANKGNAPSGVFVSVLRHVVKHCLWSIRLAKLTCQMEAMDIHYEETRLRDSFSEIKFRLPFALNDSWQPICLLLGRSGNMYWDVKISDHHFKDLWELQKGSKTTPWGSGVHIANSSDVDSHIRYDPEGVVLSYQSVEADSIKNLVADIQRLSNARKFSLVMRKLLCTKPDKGKGSGEAADRWRDFKIEAVGLTSLLFSFGSGVFARFFVEWESGKDKCTMHVSPDQLWPHTVILEEFINGAEVESVLDCILLAAGPLLALASAKRPARGSTSNVEPVVTATLSSSHSNEIQKAHMKRVGLVASGPLMDCSRLPVGRSGPVVPEHQAIMSLDDDGGYVGGCVPLMALEMVLCGVFKYLGALSLFSQLPDLLREILGSILKNHEGAILNIDQEQPALSFFVGVYVFAVSVHRDQLLLQVPSEKRIHAQQNGAQEELTQSEIGKICDYFSLCVAAEPYNASRVASFITLLTLPILVLREFLKLIAWKKGLSRSQQASEIAHTQRPRIELCLENHSATDSDSNIHYDRPNNMVDFALTIVLDPVQIPKIISAGGGAAWLLPYCVSVKLRYTFGDNPDVMFLGMEGSHGGRACWPGDEDWEKCKERVSQTVEFNGSAAGDLSQGKLKLVADSVQRTLHLCQKKLQ
ncbi:unnamed protein product [Cochlearia groenlandica]